MEKKENKRHNFSRQDCEAQWSLFADEYDLPVDDESMGSAIASVSMQTIKEKMIQAMMRGRIAIVEDPGEGIVIKQYIQHPVDGIPGGDKPLTYVAPTVAHVSQAGWGKGDESSLQMRLLRVAAALTGNSEPIMSRLKGGDRSRMETVANLFMSA